MHWSASHLLVADQIVRSGPGSRCSRPSASSPKTSSCRTAKQTMFVPRTRSYFAGREVDVLALWDGPRQSEAYEWFDTRARRICAPRSGGLPTTVISTPPRPLRSTRHSSAFWTDRYEPIAWAEELIEPARAVDHRRLAQLYAMAAQCYETGRIDDALGYAGQAGRRPSAATYRRPLPYETQPSDGVYAAHGRPERWVELVPRNVARIGTLISSLGEPRGGIGRQPAQRTRRWRRRGISSRSPKRPTIRTSRAYAPLAYGIAHHDADPSASYAAHRKGRKSPRTAVTGNSSPIIAGDLSWLAGSRANPSRGA